MTTIKDIAREAQVSPGTVDRVLHNRGGVSLETSNRISKILKDENEKHMREHHSDDHDHSSDKKSASPQKKASPEKTKTTVKKTAKAKKVSKK